MLESDGESSIVMVYKTSVLKKVVKNVFHHIGFEIHRTSEPALTPDTSLNNGEVSRMAAHLNAPPVKLHVGCGPRVLKGWINIDLSYEHYENYLQYYTERYYPAELRGAKSDFFAFDVSKSALPLPDNCVDVIFHEDFIEHLGQREQILFLAESYRVLKPGGVHRVNTPNMLLSVRDVSDFHQGYIGVQTSEWDRHGHLNVLTPKSLEETSLMIGYSRVLFGGRDASISGLIPLEYRPDPRDRSEDGNIFADLIK